MENNIHILTVFLLKKYPIVSAVSFAGVADFKENTPTDQKDAVNKILKQYQLDPSAWVNKHRSEVEKLKEQ